MKKYLKLLLITLITSVILPLTVKAASGTIYLAATNKNVAIGNTTTVNIYCTSSTPIGTCEYTLTYDSSKLALVGGGDTSIMDYASNPSTYKLGQRTYTFKVIASGTSTISVKAYGIVDWDKEQDMSVTLSPTTITGYAPTSNNTPSGNSSNNNKPNSGNSAYSTNNNLKSLAIEGYDLSPEFSKDTLKYTLELDSSIEKVKVLATKEDDKASIKYPEEVTLDYGENKIEVVVTSEKGTTKTYTIIITVKDEHPIEVKINDEKYNLVKKASLLEDLEGFEKDSITIDNEAIPVLKNPLTKITLVALKNNKTNDIKLFIYDAKNNTYEEYKPITSNNINLTVINKNSFKNYKKDTIKINDYQITVFKVSPDSSFSFFYAINNETGQEAWYMYDSKEGTIIRYNDEELIRLEEKEKKTNIIIYSFLGLTVLLIIIIMSLVSSNSNKKKVIKNIKSKEKKKHETKEPDKEIATKQDKKDEVKITEVTQDTLEMHLEKLNKSKKKKKSINKMLDEL